MVPRKLDPAVVIDRMEFVQRMLLQLRSLPAGTLNEFVSDSRNVASAESYLRRALEALLDLGRHILARAFGKVAAEYKEIADGLLEHGVLTTDEARLMRRMAGYRNRLVHMYSAVQEQELYEIVANHLGEVNQLLDTVRTWLVRHYPEFREGE